MINRFILGLLGNLFFCSLSVAMGAQPKSPNFIIIYVDDLGYGDLGLYQDQRLITPAIDELVATSQSWTDFYVSASVCSPSRGALLTGNLPVRSGLYGDRIAVLWPDSQTGMPASQITLPEQLKQYNYATAMFGKWHLGDAPEFLPTRHGFDEWLGIPYSNDMDWAVGDITSATVNSNLSTSADKWKIVSPVYQHQLRHPKVSDWNVPLIKSLVNVDQSYTDMVVQRPVDQTIFTQRFTEQSVDFIQRATQQQQPFFLFLSHSMVHVPLFRSPAFAGKSALGLYGDVLEEIDWSVGQIMQTLKTQGIKDNTYVLFTSDNGPWLTYAPEHAGTAKPLRGGKGQTFEGGMRVMTFFSGPDIEPGRVSELGMDTDIYNTFMGLAGLKSQTTAVDSYDLSATLTSQTPSPRKFVPFFRNSTLRAFRYQDHKLHFITNQVFLGPTTTHQPPLLIDLKNDIGETTDIASQHPEILAEIQRQVTRFRLTTPIAPSIFDLQKGPQQ
ncbi:MAG: arylsulfatase [Cellvibrionales bacterium]|nr:arylsulfatase [Cellvibrionales bacterium]|tara:strand:- start:8343 stop:9836 length:1494 start_codon:yes stop_codon:yes gene_type:complete